MIGELTFVAPLISQFYLITCALVNYSVYELEMNPSPAWRPAFQFYSWYSALFGFTCCVFLMFFTNWLYASVSVVLTVGIVTAF